MNTFNIKEYNTYCMFTLGIDFPTVNIHFREQIAISREPEKVEMFRKWLLEHGWKEE